MEKKPKNELIMGIGVYIYGIASIAAGIFDLIWGGFESAHQPIQAFGDHIPGVNIFAYITAVCMIVGGTMMLSRQSVRIGAAIMAIIYGIFGLFWFPRFYTAPHYLGYGISVYLGVLGGVCGQIILVVAAIIVFSSLGKHDQLSQKAAPVAHWIFGLCAVDFGLVLLTGVQYATSMVPPWMPFGGNFWVVVSGIAFVLAGAGILSCILDVLAARLLALMLIIFSALVSTPMIFTSPHDHTAWGGNAQNLVSAGAAWIFADWLKARRQLYQKRSLA